MAAVLLLRPFLEHAQELPHTLRTTLLEALANAAEDIAAYVGFSRHLACIHGNGVSHLLVLFCMGRYLGKGVEAQLSAEGGSSSQDFSSLLPEPATIGASLLPHVTLLLACARALATEATSTGAFPYNP